MTWVMTTRRNQGPTGNNTSSTRASTPPPSIILAVGETFRVPTHFHTQDEVVAYRHFLPMAVRVSTNGLVALRKDPDLALHNITLGLKSLTPFFGDFAARCPDVSLVDMLELPALALALSHAVRCVEGPAASAREIQQRSSDVRQLHADMHDYLDIAARRGVVPAKAIAGLGVKRGPIAKASDGVVIASVFRDHAMTLDGKHPFTKADVDTLATESAWLRSALKPANARRAKSQRSPESLVRDQFASLLAERHDKLRTAGVVFFGIRNVDEKVPPLYSGAVAARAKEETPGDA